MLRRPRSQERPASEKEDSDEESNEATEDSEAEETVVEMMMTITDGGFWPKFDTFTHYLGRWSNFEGCIFI